MTFQVGDRSSKIEIKYRLVHLKVYLCAVLSGY